MSSNILEARFRALDQVIQATARAKKVSLGNVRAHLSCNQLPCPPDPPHRNRKGDDVNCTKSLDANSLSSEISLSSLNDQIIGKRPTRAVTANVMSKNWFVPSNRNQTTPKAIAVSERQTSHLQSLAESDCDNESSNNEAMEAEKDKTADHQINIRIQSNFSLKDWRFAASITDISDPQRSCVDYVDLETDDENQLLFPHGNDLVECFNWLKHFAHVPRSAHTPAQTTIIDKTLSYNENSRATHVLYGRLEEHVTQNLDNSDAESQNHESAVEGQDSAMMTSKNPNTIVADSSEDRNGANTLNCATSADEKREMLFEMRQRLKRSMNDTARQFQSL